MNKDLKNTDTSFNKLKRLLNEQLWLIFLLAPLLLIAALVVPQLQSNKKPMLTASTNAMLSASIEVSSAELASIVAKPLSELLVMEVYFDHKQKTRNNARMLSLDLAEGFKNEDYNHSIANHVAVDADESIKDRTDG